MAIQLKEQLKAQQIIIVEAQKRIESRDQEVLVYQGTIEALKKRTVTPRQVVATLPQVVNLPAPIFQTPELPNAPSQTIIPTESVKPLFDRLADCNNFEHSLNACQETRTDLEKQLAAERQAKADILKAYKGGSFGTRVRRNAKWMAIGGIVTIVVYKVVKR